MICETCEGPETRFLLETGFLSSHNSKRNSCIYLNFVENSGVGASSGEISALWGRGKSDISAGGKGYLHTRR
ncbi:hypothetical protein [Kamptonema formosum]|uniref:hypothetical protein n=1 Tax=Kamptonema formosum TaxID=331992 RepID=UPI00034DBD00|nr:hypothetical protein [Oscillatoria sp. PCC 10802]